MSFLTPKRDLTKELARFTKADDEKNFNQLWELAKQAETFKHDHRNLITAKLALNFDHLAEVVNNDVPPNVDGHRNVKRLPLTGKYVIFSDHHICPDGNRHDYFKKFGNAKLYAMLLTNYYMKGYTLIENGDVEDMLVVEPNVDESKKLGNINLEKELVDLEALRATRRKKQLRAVVDSFENYTYKIYDLIAMTFQKSGRYVRIMGNHDPDLKEPDFNGILREKYGNNFMAYDYALIDGPPNSRKRASFVITHGHQFDASTMPAVAPELGEVYSECLAWAYEGADRTWKWNSHTNLWALSRHAFNNRLVSGDIKLSLDDIDTLVSGLNIGAAFNAAVRVLTGGHLKCEDFPKLGSETEVKNLIQAVFGHPIAWEYLLGTTIYQKLCQVLLKAEFFKFRHLDELHLVEEYGKRFPSESTRPVLVLGHTHEVRSNAIDASQRAYPWYLNCGSAGRFENLIWGVEIDNGVSRIVSWHFKNGPGTDGITRLEYFNQGDQLVPYPEARLIP